MINTWNESLLHEELKGRYCQVNDTLEAPVGTSICDVLHEDGSVTEIQTAHLSKLKGKLVKLLDERKVRLVFPIAETTRIETRDENGMVKSARKSPKKGTIFQLFREITGIYCLLGNTNLEIEIVFADITELRIADGTGSWRRKGIRIDNRRLDKVNSTRNIKSPDSLLELLPPGIPNDFTTADLRKAGVGIHAGHTVWVLRKLGLIEKVGTKGRFYLYRRSKRNHAKTGSLM